MADDLKMRTSKADDDSTNKGENVGDSAEVMVLEGPPSFEASLHYAAVQRLREDDMFNVPESRRTTFMARLFFPELPASVNSAYFATKGSDMEKPPVPVSRSTTVSEEEKRMAQRALRTATWVTVFYLITTDILGPFSTGWAFSQVGIVSGSLLYIFLGIIAFYTGIQLWHMYLNLDSYEYPIKTYSDLTGRIFGKFARHVVNVLQTIQLIVLVSTIIIMNAQGLSQISKGHVCFSLLAIIWMLLGMGLGQIRSLKNFGAIAHSAIWINLTAIFLTMGAIAHSPPNFVAAITQNNVSPGAVIVKAFVNQPFAPQLVGVMQMVFSYGGAMLFIELMVEMKRPFDFWKGMICAQLVIVTIYMLFGIYVYAFQGQFAINPANQGISKFGLQTAGNVLTLISGLIAAALYGNIGIKVVYSTIVEELFNGPALLSRSGRILWTVLVISYWALAFIIASAIPQFSNVNGIVAAICILQFSYTFPPILYAGFIIQRDAIQGQPEYTPGANINDLRHDTWRNLSRWRRGFARRWWLNTFNILLGLAALACAGLGAFSSIEGVITTFNTSGSATSFGCKSPV